MDMPLKPNILEDIGKDVGPTMNETFDNDCNLT